MKKHHISRFAIPISVFLILLFFSIVYAQDLLPPDPVDDLAADGIQSEEITLTWTATGDDGDVGQASAYDLRYSYDLITALNYDSAQQIDTGLSPKPAGSTETYTVERLIPFETYYFAIKVIDDEPNTSTISNVVEAETLNTSSYRYSMYEELDGTYTGTNLISDGTSFEVGEDTFNLARLMSSDEYADEDMIYRPGVFDTSTSVHGPTSYRVDNGAADSSQEDYTMHTLNWLYLEAGQDYTLSYWLKRDNELTNYKANLRDPEHNLIEQENCLPEDTEWTQCIMQIENAPIVDEQHFKLGFTSGRNWYTDQQEQLGDYHESYWIDAIQLESGLKEAGEIIYDYPRELGIGLDVNIDQPIYMTQNLESGDEIVVTVSLFLDTDDDLGKNVALRYHVIDSFERKRLSGQTTTLINDASSATVTLNLSQLLAAADPGSELEKGAFRLVVYAMEEGTNPGPILDYEELVYGSIEQNTSGADPDSPFGTHFGTWESRYTGYGTTVSRDDDWQYQLAEDLGFKWVRSFNAGQWSHVQPEEGGPIEWFDVQYDLFEAHNIQVMSLIIPSEGPEWSWATDIDGDWVRSEPYVPYNPYEEHIHDTDKVTAFAQAIVDHYGDRISIYEVANEPSFSMLPSHYVSNILEPVSDVIRAADPTTLISSPNPGPHSGWNHTSMNYIKDVGAIEGVVDRVDMVTQHMYDFTGFIPEAAVDYRYPPYDALIEWDAREANDVFPDRTLVDTESGYREGTLYTKRRTYFTQGTLIGGDRPDGDFNDAYSGSVETALRLAQYHTREKLIKMGEGIDRFFQFKVSGFPHITRAGGDLSLIEHDGSPIPTMPAFGAMMNLLDGIDLDKTVEIPYDLLNVNDSVALRDDILAYAFYVNDEAVLAIWDYDETEERAFTDPVTTLDITIDPLRITAYDFFGNEVSLSDNGLGGILLPVGNSPIYLTSSGESGSYTFEEFIGLIQSDTSLLDLPSPPSNLRAEPRDGVLTIDLSWTASPDGDISGYNLYRIKSGQTSQSPVYLNDGSVVVGTTFIDESLGEQPSYAYWVTAVDDQGYESRPVYEIVQSPWHFNVPINLQSSSIEEDSITISWQDSLGSDSNSFQYRVKLDGLEIDRVESLVIDDYTYTFTIDHLTPDIAYTIDITANDLFQVESDSAGPIIVTTDEPPDEIPPARTLDFNAS